VKVLKTTPRILVPTASRTLCRKMTETRQSTVIHAPDSATKKTLFFEVLAVGPDVVEVKVEDCIYTDRFGEQQIDFPGHDDWYIILEQDIVGIIGDFETEEGEIKEAS